MMCISLYLPIVFVEYSCFRLRYWFIVLISYYCSWLVRFYRALVLSQFEITWDTVIFSDMSALNPSHVLHRAICTIKSCLHITLWCVWHILIEDSWHKDSCFDLTNKKKAWSNHARTRKQMAMKWITKNKVELHPVSQTKLLSLLLFSLHWFPKVSPKLITQYLCSWFSNLLYQVGLLGLHCVVHSNTYESYTFNWCFFCLFFFKEWFQLYMCR